MNLNKETAMRLWNKSFGKEIKVQDFAGRIITKGAYNDRNSKYGWNIDHILPQSKGGTTADHNLICCHILTNDEKADKFPCFNSNGFAYEIIKVQNHYEIRKKSNNYKLDTDINDDVDFFDSASGVRFFKKLKGIQNKRRFVGSVLIRLNNVSNNAVVDFIEELFETENISFNNSYYRSEICVIVRNFNMPLKEDSNALLDKCVLLNTYLSSYFLECEYISKYDIYYREDCFEDKLCLYSTDINFRNERSSSLHNTIFLDEFVLQNTDAGKKVEKNRYSEYTEYNFIFTNLSKNLKKEVNRK